MRDEKQLEELLRGFDPAAWFRVSVLGSGVLKVLGGLGFRGWQFPCSGV